MSFQNKSSSSSNNSNNLWIGEIEEWMDEKYLIKALESYRTFIYNHHRYHC